MNTKSKEIHEKNNPQHSIIANLLSADANHDYWKFKNDFKVNQENHTANSSNIAAFSR